MTRTTELLKGKYHSGECDCDLCNQYRRGRLDALKEEYSFWKKSGFTEMLLGFPLIKERITSIQEEIKLIEEKI